MLSNRRAEAAAAHLHIRRKRRKHSASPAGRPCLTQINSPEQGQCTGKNSVLDLACPIVSPSQMAGGKRGTHRPWPLPGDLKRKKTLPQAFAPSLAMWCLPKSPAVKQHLLLSQLICCLHPSHLLACMTSISFYCFSLGKHKEEAAEKVSWMLLLQLHFLETLTAVQALAAVLSH